MSFDPRVLDRAFADLLRDTHGTILYQEQTYQILRRFGFEWHECDKWVKSLKINTKSLALSTEEHGGIPLYRKFAQALSDHFDVEYDSAYEYTARFTGYSFNKAHAIGYAMTAYYMMWLRVNYPLEFWCSVLHNESFEMRRANYLVAASRDGCLVLPPHVNGTRGYSIEDNAIRIGTASVKNVGEKAAEAIERGRPYESAGDLRERVPKRQANSKVLAALEEAGALEFEPDLVIARAVELNKFLAEAKVNLRLYEGAQIGRGASATVGVVVEP